jgi:integrase
VFERWHCVGVLPDWIGIEVKLMYDVVVPRGSFQRNTRVASVRAAWGYLVKLFRKSKSKYYWYDFTVRSERYRGSTKETNKTRAQKAAALKLAAAIKGSDPLDRKPPTLREYSKDFLQWVETGRLEADSRRYYRNGWRLLEQTKIAGMRMDQITKDEVEKLQFPGSASNGNNALRTLRRMYSKAKEHKTIFEVPDFALFKEHGRSLRLNDEAERRLSAVADQPLKDIIVVMRDTGMRNARELYCMRVENVDFDAGTIFTPDSKTESGRRFIPMSSRVKQILEARCDDAARAGCGCRVIRESTLGKGWCTGNGRGRGKSRGCRANSSSTVRATTSGASCWPRPEI